MTEHARRVQGCKKRRKAGIAPACYCVIAAKRQQPSRCLLGLGVLPGFRLLVFLVERGALGLGVERTILVIFACIDLFRRLLDAGDAVRIDGYFLNIFIDINLL